MDPKETLRLAEQAIYDGEYEDATEHLNNYREWRERGGFEPCNVSVNGAGFFLNGDEFAMALEDLTVYHDHDGQPDEAQEWHDFDPDC